jgi:hypothetical protein
VSSGDGRSRDRWIDLDTTRAQKYRHRSRRRCRRRADMETSTDTRIRTRTWADTAADMDTETNADLDLGTGTHGHTATHTENTDTDARPCTTPATGAGMQAYLPTSVHFMATVSICHRSCSSFSCHLLHSHSHCISSNRIPHTSLDGVGHRHPSRELAHAVPPVVT